MISCNLDDFLKDPTSKYSHIGVRASTHEFGVGEIHAMTLHSLDFQNSCFFFTCKISLPYPKHPKVLTHFSINPQYKVLSKYLNQVSVILEVTDYT